MTNSNHMDGGELHGNRLGKARVLFFVGTTIAELAPRLHKTRAAVMWEVWEGWEGGEGMK